MYENSTIGSKPDKGTAEEEAFKMITFFRSVFANCERGYVSLWGKKDTRKPSVHIPVADLARVVETAEAINRDGYDTYFGVGLREEDLGQGRRGGEPDVFGISGYFIDIDYGMRGHAAKNLPATFDDAVELLDTAGIDPTVLVDSGGGVHAYVLFDQPWYFSSATDRAQAKRECTAFQTRVVTIAEARGWHVDVTADLARVLRVPGTLNRKTEPYLPVKLILADGPRLSRIPFGPPLKLSPKAFGRIVELIENPRPPTEALKELMSGHTSRDYVVAGLGDGTNQDNGLSGALGVKDASYGRSDGVAQVRIDGPGSTSSEPVEDVRNPDFQNQPTDPTKSLDRVKEQLGKCRREGLKELCQSVIKGTPFSVPGQRDSDINRVCGLIGDIDSETDPEVLADLFRPAIVATAERDGDWKGDEERIYEVVVEKLTRAQGRARERKTRDKEINEAFMSQGTSTIKTTTEADRGKFETYAKEHGCTPAQFLKRLVIIKADSHHVFSNGRYQAPISHSELAVSLPRDWADMPIQWDIAPKEDGTPRKKRVPELLIDYATVARDLIADLTIDHGVYEPATQLFREAVCPKRALEAAYDPQIDAWLRIFTGQHYEKILDWIATITRLDIPSCAVYFSGPPGTGKSLFSKGLSRIWNSGPTELKRIFDNFNSDLTKCPLILCDEAMPVSYNGQKTSAQTRELIACTSRTLSRKFLPNADLHGAIRLILAGNNDNMISIEDEDLSPEDINAIAVRFLHIKTPETARNYLESIGGREVTSTWIEQDKLAKHALWLKENRVVTSGKRFLVEGEKSSVLRMLATKPKFTAFACEWIARYLEKPLAANEVKGRVLIGNGEILINASVISDLWEAYLPKTRPTAALTGKSLSHISTGIRRENNKRFHCIDVEMVLEWIDTNQLGNIDELRVKINAPSAALRVV